MKPLVLVVEDDVELNQLVSESLAEWYRVATAVDAQDGLRKAMDLKPDIIIVDIMTPHVSDDELVSEIRAQPDLSIVPIIMLSPKPADALCVRMLRCGVRDHVTTPVSVDELHSRVAYLVEQRRAEQAVRHAEAKFRGIVSIASDAIISIDGEQRIVLYNKGAEAIFGWRADEILGKPLDVLLPERFRERHRWHVGEFAESGKQARRMAERGPELFGLHKNGREFPAEAAISKLDVDGERLFTVVLRDITEQRRIEKEQQFLADVGECLAATLDYQTTLSSIAQLAVRDLADWCIVDLVTEDGRLERAKVACADPAKSGIADALARLPLDDTEQYPVRSVLDTKQAALIEDITPELLESLVPNEEQRATVRAMDARSALAVPLIARSKLLGIVVLVSSTAARSYRTHLHLVQELAHRAALALDNSRLYAAAQSAIRARDRVLGIVAHDLRTPLNGIVLQSELLRRHATEPERPVELIRRAARHMTRLNRDLLDISRIEVGRELSIEPERVAASKIIPVVVETLKPVASTASLTLQFDVASDVPEVWADSDRLAQVLENLIANSIKFTPAGGTITVRALAAGGQLLVSIADTGFGIAPQHLPHVFERYWQDPKTDHHDHHGAGLGLAIVKAIVEGHGGRIWAESQPGSGSTFYFTVPLADAGDSTYPRHDASAIAHPARQ